jgi:Ca2+/Na+ antiporter
MDDLERDKFYATPGTPPDDDDYELEPPDETVEEVRKRDLMQSLENRIDIDEVYREAERKRGSEILEDWVRNFRFRFRFQVKHLFIATAVVAIALALFKLQILGTAVIVLIMLCTAGLYIYLTLEERKQQAEADRKREALYAKRRARMAPRPPGAHVVGDSLPPEEPTLSNVAQSPGEAEHIWQDPPVEKEAFRFQFSLRELIMLITMAAVVLGMIHIFGGPAATATVLGLFALVGLFVFAFGYEPPRIIVLGWWLTLMLYVVVVIFAALCGFA